MAPENLETTMVVSRSIVLCLSLIIYSSPVFADEPNELYRQLSMSNAKNAQFESAPRLSDVLLWKDVLADTLSQHPAADSTDTYKLATFSAPQQMKRVFCNGFTGCGGRFRGRRRIPLPEDGYKDRRELGKRPFCNTYGCYNSGRKRSIETPKENIHEPSKTEDQRLITFADQWPWNRIKKLFCNGYGGCQNMGKRLQMRPDSRLIASGHTVFLPFSKESLDLDGGKKRFFTSGFDDDMDSLIDSMRR